ncbi:hypothetical protein JCM10207_001805 [Rhodosporidiobolus poonsookiae]
MPTLSDRSPSDPSDPTPPSAAPTSTPSASSSLTPAERARQAAEARSRGPQGGPVVSTSAEAHSRTVTAESFAPSRADVLPFHRILDAQLLPKCSKPQAVKTLETVQQLLGNILSPPNPAAASKFRQIRLSNKLIQQSIVDPANGAAQDYLIAAGFRSENKEFVPYLTFTPSPTPGQLHKLRVAHHVVGLKLMQAKEAEERETRYRESEKKAEAARKEKALLGYEEDRRLRAERDERERFVRDARPPPNNTYQVRSTGPSAWHPTQRGGGSGARRGGARGGVMRGMGGGPLQPSLTAGDDMDEDEDEGDEEYDDAEAGTDDAPPAYGELHGRVLGTGLPPEGETAPEGVNMVNAQDLEEE